MNVKNIVLRGCGSAAVAFGAASAMLPAQAFADEGSGVAAILPQMDEFIPMLVAFIILWIILAKFGWPLFEGMLVKRETTIKDARVLAEYKRQLEETKAQSAQIIADAKKTGEAVKADITAKAQAEAAGMIEKAHAAIEADKKAAIAELQGSVADLSVAVASRLIGEDLNDDQHRKIIERYATEAGSFNAN